MSSNVRVDKEKLQQSLNRLWEIYQDINDTVNDVSLWRCPYKNKDDRCTARFGLPQPVVRRRPRPVGPVYRQRQVGLPNRLETRVSTEGGSTKRCLESATTTGNWSWSPIEPSLIMPTNCRFGSLPPADAAVNAMNAWSRSSGAWKPFAHRRTQRVSLRENYRLACQARVTDANSDVEFALLRRQPQILSDSTHRQVELYPLITRRGDDVYLGETRIDRYRGQPLRAGGGSGNHHGSLQPARPGNRSRSPHCVL